MNSTATHNRLRPGSMLQISRSIEARAYALRFAWMASRPHASAKHGSRALQVRSRDLLQRGRRIASRVKQALLRRGSPPVRAERRPSGTRVALGDLREQRGGDGLPIVFMHRGNSDYLLHTFSQARLSNPRSPIYLLGDSTNDAYPWVTHEPFTNYYKQAQAFADVYRHFSTNEYIYTRFDFQRWLILAEFLRAKGYSQCLYLDSDVMLYTDVTRDIAKFAAYDFAMAHITGSVFFLNDLATLEDLGSFILNIYTRKDRYHYDRMVAHYLARQHNRLPGGACDMMALYYYRELHFGRVGEVAQVIDGSVYDLNIGEPQGFAMRDQIKDLTWVDGIPYGKHLRTGQTIRFNSLHFQGGRGKALLRKLYGKDPAESAASQPLETVTSPHQGTDVIA
jgi:hypothetical protein